jgi:hypothetical protein
MKRSMPVANYQELTAQERFQLVLAASGRGDDAEVGRLAATGGRIPLSVYEHLPYVQAFYELGTLVFLELLDLAAQYTLALARVGFADAAETEREADAAEEAADPPGDTEPAGDDADESTSSDRLWDTALALGFRLRTRAEGWRLFCERLAIPPFVLLDLLPGFHRLQSALSLAEDVALAPEGMARWMNRIRPAGTPEVTTAMLITPAKIAAELAEQFGTVATQWGGRGNRG